jgi:putative endonuclease
MTAARQGLGRRGEELAVAHLRAQGWAIVARNVRYPEGELDIVSERGGRIAFVEVRTRRGRAYGSPEESITIHKRRRLLLAAQRYLQEHALEHADWRIDLAAIELSSAGRLIRLDVLEGAITGEGL